MTNSLRAATLLVLAAMLAACQGDISVGERYRPPVDYQMSVNRGINYESDLMACRAEAAQIPESQRILLGSAGGAAVGTPVGAIAGAAIGGVAVLGAATSGALAGAAIGPAIGAATLVEQSLTVSDCMANRGYELLR